MAALTLIESAKKYEDDPIRQAVIEIYAQSTDLLRDLPFIDIPGNALKYDQESTLPGIGFRGINEAYPTSIGVINPIVETLVIAGGDLDVDKAILKTRGEGQRAVQEAMKIKALAHVFTHKFFKGDSVTTPREFDGLQVRLTGNQLLANGGTAGGDALSLLKLDEAIDRVMNPTHLAMNQTMPRLLTAAARNTAVSGFIHYTTDQFGKRITHYNNIPILVVGNQDDVYNTLDFTEANPGGGGNVGTSIYVLSLGEATLVGIQNGDIEARDLGELQAQPSMRTRIEWMPGIALFHPRSACRLYGIKNAAVVA